MTQQSVSVQNFDAIKFELEREQKFNQSQWCGCVYRVWDGRILLGTFYQKQKKWIANPYYKNRNYLRLEQSLERTFNSNQRAINHIIRSYEGN